MSLSEKITKSVHDAIMPKLQEFIISADAEMKEGQKKFLVQVSNVFEEFEKNLEKQVAEQVDKRLRLFELKQLGNE